MNCINVLWALFARDRLMGYCWEVGLKFVGPRLRNGGKELLGQHGAEVDASSFFLEKMEMQSSDVPYVHEKTSQNRAKMLKRDAIH